MSEQAKAIDYEERIQELHDTLKFNLVDGGKWDGMAVAGLGPEQLIHSFLHKLIRLTFLTDEEAEMKVADLRLENLNKALEKIHKLEEMVENCEIMHGEVRDNGKFEGLSGRYGGESK